MIFNPSFFATPPPQVPTNNPYFSSPPPQPLAASINMELFLSHA